MFPDPLNHSCKEKDKRCNVNSAASFVAGFFFEEILKTSCKIFKPLYNNNCNTVINTVNTLYTVRTVSSRKEEHHVQS